LAATILHHSREVPILLHSHRDNPQEMHLSRPSHHADQKNRVTATAQGRIRIIAPNVSIFQFRITQTEQELT